MSLSQIMQKQKIIVTTKPTEGAVKVKIGEVGYVYVIGVKNE